MHAQQLTGTWRMVGLELRTAWRSLALVVAVYVGLVLAVVISVSALYPTLEERIQYSLTAGTMTVSVAFNGRGYGLTNLGGITGVEVGFTGQVLFPILAVLVAVRLTRREEEAGRIELLTASRVGRLSPLAAATILIAAASLVTGVGMLAGMVAADLPVEGSAWYSAGMAACLLCFGAVGLLLAELCQQTRTAQQLGIAVVTAAFLVRFMVDAMQWELTWLSPLGWLPEVRAFAGPRAWPLWAFGGASVLLLGLSALAAMHRDAGAGLIAPRPGPAHGSVRAARSWRMALRLERTGTITWLVLLCIWVSFVGLFSKEMTKVVDANPSMLEALGVTRGSDLLVLMAAVVMVAGAGAVAVQGATHLGTEESSGRLGLLVSTRCSRERFWLGWWVSTLGSAVVVLELSALVLGLSTWAVTGELETLWVALRVGRDYLLPTLVIAGVAALLASLGPRWPGAAWLLVAWTAVVGFLAEVLRLPEWARDLSPAYMVGVLPVDHPHGTVLVGQAVAAVLLLTASWWLFRRRELCAG
ncbi:ABC-2 family transporter protein [Actinomyces bovis]|uniref:ABC-2 family transporter protein n=1 Tax=Actinomyces bovis TaxID=1658 RepID=A0ABY1VN08_9ACTO|nr:ABC transporter [Actinomyces bovis]SPT53375.1 ABC-2 family transporter protein [Actinomyces bovis]VEG52766.1 ABC-2 family transporter protein [Actinomyces israelii]